MLERTACAARNRALKTIAIGRQAQPRLYGWFQPAPECLVREELRWDR